MPRKRMIHPGFWDDPDIARLEPLDRLLAIGMISLADDWGNCMADEFYLKKKIFGFDPITQFQVEAMRDRIFKQCRNFTRYDIDGQVYVHLENWDKHQTLRYRAKPEWPSFPGQDCTETGWHSSNPAADLPDDSDNCADDCADDSARDSAQSCAQDCAEVAQLCDNSAQIGGPREEKIREEKPSQEKQAKPSQAKGLAALLRGCGIKSQRAIDKLLDDDWVTAERVRACWDEIQEREDVASAPGMLCAMLRDHDEYDPVLTEEEERYRYIRGQYADYINVERQDCA